MGRLKAACPLIAICGFTLLACGAPAVAQGPGARPIFYPLGPGMPTGTAADWAAKMGKGAGGYFQPVRIELPGGGAVTYFDGSPERPVSVPAPAQAGFLIGPVYRLKISDIPAFPGAELYPSIEVLDRLHPPFGRAAEFPVLIQFSEEEIGAALEGRFLTKVVYLEQPNRALPIAVRRGTALPTRFVAERENPLLVADVAGRPMLIVRLGGRLPNPEHEHPGFFGSGAPVRVEKVRVEEEAPRPEPPEQ